MDDLTLIERNDLQYHEQRIEQWSKHTELAADSFRAIRDGKLYKSTHARFEDYCRDRWGHTRQHINRLIRAVDIVDHLEMEPNGSKVITESQARELAKVPEVKREEVVEQTVKRDGKLTARGIKETATETAPVEVIEEKKPVGLVGFAMSYAEGAINNLKKIPHNDVDIEKAYTQVLNHCINHLTKHKLASKIQDGDLDSEWQRLEAIRKHLSEPKEVLENWLGLTNGISPIISNKGRR
jgi:hypothetical protein